MADEQVVVRLVADASGLEKGSARAENALSGIEKMNGSGLGFGILAGIGQAAFSKITGAVADTAAAIIDVGSSFEKQMSRVEAISGASATDIALITEKARQMGATTSFSASEAGKAMEYMAMAGWKAQDMVEGIGGIMDLAAASGEELGATSDIVTDALTAFGMQAKDSGRFADVLAAASSNANTNVSLMGETFKYVGAAAGAMGYNVEDMSIAIGLMANSGIKGTQAGTALRSTITRLAKPTKESREAMERLGLSLTDSEGNMLSFRDIMTNMRSGFADLTESEKASTAAMLGGQEAMSGLLAIVNASDADFEKLAGAIDNAGGSAHRMAETQMDNLSGSLTRFQSAAEGLGIALYDTIKGPLTGLVEFGTAVLGGITALLSDHRTEAKKYADSLLESVENAKRLADSTRDWEQEAAQSVGELESYRDVLLAVAGAEKANEYQKYQVSQIVAKLGSSVPELTAAWNEQTGVLSLTRDEINDLINAQENYARQTVLIKAKQAAYEALYEAELDAAKAEGMMEAEFDKAATLVNNKLSSMGEPIPVTIHSMEELQAAYNRLRDTGDDEVLNGLVMSMHAVEQAQGVLDAAVPVVEDARDALEVTTRAADKLAAATDGVTEAVKESTAVTEESAEAAAAQEAAAGRVAAAQGTLSKAYQDAKNAAVDAFDSAKKAAESAFSIDPFSGWADSSENGAAKMRDSLAKQAESMAQYKDNMNKIMEQVGATQGGQEFISYLEGLGPAGATAVAQMAQNGGLLEEAMKAYVDAANIQDELTSQMAANAVAMEYGLNLIGSKADEWDFLERIVGDLAESGADISETIAASFAEAAETAKAVGVKIPDGLAESILSSESPAEAIVEATAELRNVIDGNMAGLIEAAGKAGLEVPSSITDGIEEGGPAAVKAFNELMSLFSGAEITRKAEESGKAAGETQTAAQASGMKAKQEDVKSAANTVTETGVKAARDKEPAFETAGGGLVKAMAKGMAERASEVASAGEAVGKAGADAAGGTASLWSNAGNMAAAGFAGGIRNGQSLAISAATALAAASIEAAKKRLDEHSPSREFRNEVGFMGGKGFALGLTDATGLVSEAAWRLADTSVSEAVSAAGRIGDIYDRLQRRLRSGAGKGNFENAFSESTAASSKSIEKAVKNAEESLKKTSDQYFTALSDANASKLEALEARQTALQGRHSAELKAIAERQETAQGEAAKAALKAERKSLEERQEAERKSLTAEIDGLRKRKQKIDKLSGEFASSVLSAYDSALETQAERIDRTLNDSLEKAAKAAQDKMDALNGKIVSMRSGLLGIGETWDGFSGGHGLIENVKGQIREIRSYERQMEELEGRGISKTLISEIAGMDASQASDFMGVLAVMSDEELAVYDRLFRKRAKEAKRVATEHYAEEVQAVKDGYTDKIEAAFAKAQKAIAEMGRKTMRGFLKGMKESGYSREIRKMAKNIIATMADELDIHSPSRKAEKLAVNYDEGWNVGIRRREKVSERTMESYARKVSGAYEKGVSDNLPDLFRMMTQGLREAESGGARKMSAYAYAPAVSRGERLPMAATSPELSSVPAAAAGDREYKVTLITTLDGREIARGTAKYTQAELDRMETVRARRKGKI